MSGAKKKWSKWPKTLFPLPRNRKRRPTDAETLLHAIAIGIRDHVTHAELRQLIRHLPRIRNRKSPFDATQQENFELQEKVGELERELKKLRQRKSALTEENGLAVPEIYDTVTLTPEAREAFAKHIREWVVTQKKPADYWREV